MKKKSTPVEKKNLEISPGTARSYDTLKVFEGQYYKGMKVGGRHKWKYEPGEWKETKRTPDLWQFHYQVKKRRAGKAPEGSGVAVGTEYHWAILASQTVKKIDANTYETDMHGLKYKVAYKKADKDVWSIGSKAQRKRLIGFLQNVIVHLEQEELEAKAPKQLTQQSQKRNMVKAGDRSRKILKTNTRKQKQGKYTAPVKGRRQANSVGVTEARSKKRKVL